VGTAAPWEARAEHTVKPEVGQRGDCEQALKGEEGAALQTPEAALIRLEPYLCLASGVTVVS